MVVREAMEQQRNQQGFMLMLGRVLKEQGCLHRTRKIPATRKGGAVDLLGCYWP